MKTIAIGYLVFVCLISGIAFAFYGWDKRQSRREGWRTPESRLHALAFLGGWPGAIVGQKAFRHKTQKLSFKVLTGLAATVHVFGVVAFLYFWIRN